MNCFGISSTTMIQGIYTPNLVPFREDGSINEDELRRMVNWLIEKGISGLYPNGSTGEFIRLSFEERKRGIRIEGLVSDVDAALIAAEDLTVQLGTVIITRRIARPADSFAGLLHFSNVQNPLYGGRDQFLPSDYSQPKDHPMNQQAIGVV